MRLCAYPRCPARLTTGRYCKAHAVDVEHARPNVAVRRWYRIARWCNPVWGRRAQALARYPLCAECATDGRVVPATEVDHVVPHRGDPVLFWDLNNLRGLCARHHGEKTGRGQ